MGITNTIAKLKAYFEEWHKNAHSHNDTDLYDDITELSDEWDSRKDAIDSTINLFNSFINGYVSNNTITWKLKDVKNYIDQHINSKGGHGMGTWEELTYKEVFTDNKNHGSALVNKQLGLISLRYDTTYKHYKNDINNWRTIDSINVKAPYRPKHHNAHFSISPYTEAAVLTNGNFRVKCIYGSTTTVQVTATGAAMT